MEKVNKIMNGAFYTRERNRFTVTITNDETGEVIYTTSSEGGILCTVERYNVLKKTSEVEGNQQQFMWGHPAIIVHASMEHREKMERIILEDPVFRDAVGSFFNEK